MDMLALFQNARVYNQEGSEVYNDSLAMETAFEDAWMRFAPADALPEITDDDLFNSDFVELQDLPYAFPGDVN
jgi:hypothetical protein